MYFVLKLTIKIHHYTRDHSFALKFTIKIHHYTSRDHPFSVFTKSSKKPIFLTSGYAHVHVNIRG